MFELPSHSTTALFIEKLKRLALFRKQNKIKEKRVPLSAKHRKEILLKTDNKCHVCGIALTDKFEADHVKSHSSGGASAIENYLPSCKLCNNYRWHYTPEEIQWILKIGVWAKTQMMLETSVGKQVAEAFIRYELKR